MIASMPVALMPFLQNSCVAALSRRPRADSSSLAPPGGECAFFFAVLFSEGLAMSPNFPAAAPHQQAASVRAEKIRTGKPVCIAIEQTAADQFAGSVR